MQSRKSVAGSTLGTYQNALPRKQGGIGDVWGADLGTAFAGAPAAAVPLASQRHPKKTGAEPTRMALTSVRPLPLRPPSCQISMNAHSSDQGSRDICRDGPSSLTMNPSEKFAPVPVSGSNIPGSTENIMPVSRMV